MTEGTTITQVWVDESTEEENNESKTHLVCLRCFLAEGDAHWSLCGAWEENPVTKFSDIEPDDCPDCVRVAKDPCYRCGGDTGW